MLQEYLKNIDIYKQELTQINSGTISIAINKVQRYSIFLLLEQKSPKKHFYFQ